MNYVICLMVIAAVFLQLGVVTSRATQRLSRNKRTLLQMCELIERYTSQSCIDYNDYGCFCGWGNAGSGGTPLDDVDQCCRQHDNCYGDVMCVWIYPQLVGYNIQCTGQDECSCTDPSFWRPCARSVCECDLRFAECLGRAQYNNGYRNYNWHHCTPDDD